MSHKKTSTPAAEMARLIQKSDSEMSRRTGLYGAGGAEARAADRPEARAGAGFVAAGAVPAGAVPPFDPIDQT